MKKRPEIFIIKQFNLIGLLYFYVKFGPCIFHWQHESVKALMGLVYHSSEVDTCVTSRNRFC